MGIKFKCKHSGNVFEFFTEHDIKTMRVHDEYEEVKEEEIKTETVKKTVQKPQKSKDE